MAKFYLRCGQFEVVQTVDCVESAALSMIDRILEPHLWIYEDPELDNVERLQHLMVEALLHLPTEIQVSERGFGQSEIAVVPVPDTIERWHRFMVETQSRLTAAGVSRRLRSLVHDCRSNSTAPKPGADRSACPRLPR